MQYNIYFNSGWTRPKSQETPNENKILKIRHGISNMYFLWAGGYSREIFEAVGTFGECFGRVGFFGIKLFDVRLFSSDC